MVGRATAHVDNHPALLLHHVREHRARHEEGALEVDINVVRPRLGIHPVSRGHGLDDARVVDEDIHMPEGVEDARNRCFHLVPLGNVHGQRQCGAPPGLDLLGHCIHLGSTTGKDSHVRALCRQEQGRGPSNAPTPAGDNGHAPGQAPHPRLHKNLSYQRRAA